VSKLDVAPHDSRGRQRRRYAAPFFSSMGSRTASSSPAHPRACTSPRSKGETAHSSSCRLLEPPLSGDARRAKEGTHFGISLSTRYAKDCYRLARRPSSEHRTTTPLYLVAADLASSFVSPATLAAFSDCFLRISLISASREEGRVSDRAPRTTGEAGEGEGVRTAVGLLEDLLGVVAALGREVTESLEVGVLEDLRAARVAVSLEPMA